MKKTIVCLLTILCITGCSFSNTPSSKVELYLNNYNNLSDEVIMDIEKSAINENLNNGTKELYKEVLSKQYEDMKYEIKNESIDGNSAIVTVKISVYNLYKVDQESRNYLGSNMSEFNDENGVFDSDSFNTYRVNQLSNATDRIDYEIDFYLDKGKDEWILRNPDRKTLEKLNGFYNYNED